MRPKYTTLYFRSKDLLYAPYPVDALRRGQFQDYYVVMTYPRAEMTSGGLSPTAVAEDFVSTTMSSRWHWTLRRTISAGDFFTLHPDFYMFIRASEVDMFKDRFTVLTLPVWNHLAIIHLQLREQHARTEPGERAIRLPDEQG